MSRIAAARTFTGVPGRPAATVVGRWLRAIVGACAFALAGAATGLSAAPATERGTPEPAAKASAAASVEVRVWPHKGFGRVVFDWPVAVKHTTELSGRDLVVRFERPLSARLDAITSRLGRYVVSAETGKDGKSVVLELKPRIRFRSFVSGNGIVVDLRVGKAKARAARKKGAGGGADPVVSVRVGEHARYSRLVFDWPVSVDYKVERGPGRATVRFSRPGRLDFRALRRDRPPFVLDAEQADTRTGPAARLRLTKGARIRHFRSGTAIVVDILKPSSSSAAGSTPEKKAAEAGTPTPAKARSSAPARDAAAEATAVARAEPRAEARGPVAVMTGADDPAAEPSDSRSGPVALMAKELARKVASSTTLPVTLKVDPKGAAIRFLWEDEVAAAVFQRGRTLWAVFDRDARMAFSGWPASETRKASDNREEIPEWVDRLGAATSATIPGNAVFRMKLPKGVTPHVGRSRTTWIVRLDRRQKEPRVNIAVETHFIGVAGARLNLPVANAGEAIRVRDPDAGDFIWVVPVPDAGHGLGLARRYTELELLTTAQGIAGVAMSDGIAFRTLRGLVEITRNGGLSLSGTDVSAGRSLPLPSAGKKGENLSWLFGMEKWHDPANGGFLEQKHALLKAAYASPPAQRGAARLSLAQLYFAHGLYADASGLLDVIEEDEPELARGPVFRALRGASRFQLHDFTRAREALFHPSLDSFSEAALWRGAVSAKERKWVAATQYFSRADNLFRTYPRDLRIQFGLLAAEAAIHSGDLGLARFHLETLAKLKTDRHAKARAAFLMGRLLEKSHDPVGAAAAWAAAIEGPDRKIRARAVIARVAVLKKHGKVDGKAVVRELEKLRFGWRGDNLEFTILENLGRAYLAEKDYKNGLMALRDAARYFPKHPGTDGVIDMMRKAFVKLYVGDAADRMPPLVALALYDEFRELTPPGKVGDDLIAKLAGRLVEVDLLDRAATLLAHLVDRRLTGGKRLEVANRLAFVYLLDRKPEKALAVLTGRFPGDIVPEIAADRRHLRARALGELARYKEALAELAGDESREAGLLRAEVYWRLKDWPNAARAYRALIEADRKAGRKFTDPVQRNVLNLAIAAALAGENKALAGIAKRYGSAMAKGRYSEAFRVVTSDTAPVPDSYKLIAETVAQADQFRAFMKGYREKLMPKRGIEATPAPSPAPGLPTSRAPTRAPQPAAAQAASAASRG